jgi:poly(glycerol-phosphate) alpha-glucosyltransferase
LEKEHDTQIDILSVSDEFAAQDRQLWGSLSFHLYPPRLAAFRYAPQLSRDLVSIAPDLVHTHGLWTYLSIAARRWSKSDRAKRPYIVSPHGMLDRWALRNSRGKKIVAAVVFERQHLMNAACVHAFNESEAAAIREFGLKNPICIIPNGVEMPMNNARELEVPWDPALVTGRKVLLYLGRLHPKKGLSNLLRGWEKTRKKGKGWMLIIAGWDQGGHRSKLEQLTQELQISDSVKFIGPIFGSQRDAAYQNGDAFVLPSLSEGQPLTILEAWSHGLPVLMTLQCNLVEGFDAGAGIPMKPTVEGAIVALEVLFSLSESELSDMGQNGQRLVKEQFSWPQISAEMFAVYRWVTGTGPLPKSVVTS